MRNMTKSIRATLMGSVAAGALLAVLPEADAGGFAIREQSTESQGASFAGNAATTSLGAMYWNPAAVANKQGLNTESNYALILPRAEVNVDSVSVIGGPVITNGATFGPRPNSSDIAGPAIVPASYGSYSLPGGYFLGFSMNSGFGLVTQPDVDTYDGAVLGRTSKLFTTNLTPTFGMKLGPSIAIGIGAQIQYAEGTFKFATGSPLGVNTWFNGDDVAFGATAGIMLAPSAGTRIGLGWRSALTHTLEGRFATNTGGGVLQTGVASEVDVKLPDIVTLSIQQALAPNLRLLGTVEWSNWSRFNELRVTATGTGITVLGAKTPGQTVAVIDANWENGWFFSLGTEYDYTKTLTLRGGLAYEISPVTDPTKRIIGIPDSDRIWASLGATYKYSEKLTFDIAYTHIFLDDARFDRNTIGTGLNLKGSVDASTDILSVSMKTKW